MYWNSAHPYISMDGPETTYCVNDRMVLSTTGSVTTIKHDYERADCSERHHFLCQHESGNPSY